MAKFEQYYSIQYPMATLQSTEINVYNLGYKQVCNLLTEHCLNDNLTQRRVNHVETLSIINVIVAVYPFHRSNAQLGTQHNRYLTE